MIEFCLHLFEVETILCKLVPRQVEHGVEIGILCAVVGRLLIQSLEFLKFLLKMLLSVLVPLLFLGTTLKFRDIVLVITQLFLNGTNLLLQEVLTLLLRQILSSTQLYARLQVDKLRLLAQNAK